MASTKIEVEQPIIGDIPAGGPRPPLAVSAQETETAGSDAARIRTTEVQAHSGARPAIPRRTFGGSNSAAEEQYRLISTKLGQHAQQPKVLLITSPGSGDGKTVTAINLAFALSLHGSRVLLLDFDFQRSTAAHMLGFPAASGFSEILQGESSLDRSLVQIAANCFFLAPGVASKSKELITSNSSRELLDALRSEFDLIVIDAPPIGPIAEYELLEAACDGVVFVVRQDHTDRNLWRQAIQKVPKAKQLGVILNCADT
jgi:capsular exopolysaccharide synthesis family protein